MSLRRNEREFREALLAALVIAGCTSVATTRDEHHRRFDQMMERLRQLQAEAAPGIDQLPRVINPSMMGYYRDAHEMLVQGLGNGMTSVTIPDTGVVRITLSQHRAEHLLKIFEVSAEAQALLAQLAAAFLAPLPARSHS
jgi:hypothetical protein